MEKVEQFENELKFIKDKKLRDIAESLIEILPDYFFEVGASSTGKYHPKYAQGEGGLVRHTRAAMKIANELYNLEQHNFSDREKDLMLIALLMHDGWKHGDEKSEFTIFEHPVVASKNVRNFLTFEICPDDVEFITMCIDSHMGQWNTNYKSIVKLVKPTYSFQQFVHLCDYLASRKILEVQFE